LRRNREEVETNAAGRWEVCDGTFDLCAWRVGRCVIKAPEAMPCVSGKRRDRHRLNEIISGHVGNAIGRVRDDATYCSLAHGRDGISSSVPASRHLDALALDGVKLKVMAR
jgi:hypothetical protein